MIYVETPANPTNDLVDIAATKELARKLSTPQKEVLLVVDNTFLGPVWQHPLNHGADLVIYSATKFIGGHSDVIAGACLGSKKLMHTVKTTRTFFGSMASPWTGWLLMRSLETLKIRMTHATATAKRIADHLVKHPKVEKVNYLGHLKEGTRQHNIYRKQCLAPGSMISFSVKGGEAEAFRFLNNLKLIKLAVSLGGTESLAEHPASMTHSDIEPGERMRIGIRPSMVRLSVGLEAPEDIIAALDHAFAHV
jgi:methionine-gamma-lyase